MSKKRFLSIVLSAVMILSLACSALAVGQSGRYIGNSTVNGSIYQTYYQVDAQTRTGMPLSLQPLFEAEVVKTANYISSGMETLYIVHSGISK